MMELYIGSHLSTAGGWNALLERSHEEGGTAFAFFPRSPYGKRSKALDPAGAAAFGARLKAEGYGPLVVHAHASANANASEKFLRNPIFNAPCFGPLHSVSDHISRLLIPRYGT